MEQNSNNQSRIRRSKTQIIELLKEFEVGDLRIPAFCNLHMISKTTFHKWQSRYKGEHEHKQAIGFAKLNVTAPILEPPALLFAEVAGIKLYQPVAASYLKQLARP